MMRSVEGEWPVRAGVALEEWVPGHSAMRHWAESKKAGAEEHLLVFPLAGSIQNGYLTQVSGCRGKGPS